MTAGRVERACKHEPPTHGQTGHPDPRQRLGHRVQIQERADAAGRTSTQQHVGRGAEGSRLAEVSDDGEDVQMPADDVTRAISVLCVVCHSLHASRRSVAATALT